MHRRLALLSAFVSTLLGLLLLTANSALADTTPPYPAPPVTSTAVVVLGTSSSVVQPTGQVNAAPGTQLPNTGAGFDVVTVGLIAAAVVALGLLLVFIGYRRTRTRHH